MAKIPCKCGNVISDVAFPDQFVGDLMTSTEKSDCYENVKDLDEADTMPTYECDKCGRMIIQKDGKLIYLMPENGVYIGILKG